MDTVLSIDGISKTYGRVWAVQNLSLSVKKGQVYGILGPNGSGKTTTLGIILGVIRADSGTYNWFNSPPAAKHRRRIGALIEQPNFYPWLSGEQNLKITAAIREVPPSSVDDALTITGLRDRGRDSFVGYSLGMKQRLGIASALLGDPDILVLDEPTNGVDAQGIADIRNIILKVASKGKTVILASHILDEVEKVCDSVAVLRDGEVLESGNISRILNPGDIIEVAAENMDTLAKKLDGFPGIKSIEKIAGMININAGSDVSPGDLNLYLSKQGIILTHLYRKKRSLESRFLELLDDEKK